MAFVRPSAVSKFARTYDLIPEADLTLSEEEKSYALVEYFDALVHRLDLPVTLRQLNITPDDIPYLSQGATEVQRLIKNVPMPVEKNQIEEIYRSIR